MATDKTVRMSLRIKTAVHAVIVKQAEANGLDPSAFVQNLIETALKDLLPEDLKREIEDSNRLRDIAQDVARRVDQEGRFDEHFTLTVIREMMADGAIRSLYESLVGGDAYRNGAPGKWPLNMFLGYYIKNAVGAEPMMDEAGKPRRAFVRNEPIQSYTLLRRG